jgi:hypothetical protein
MNALARRDVVEPAALGAQPVVSKPRAPVVDKPMASKCVKIENAFDADELAIPDCVPRVYANCIQGTESLRQQLGQGP